MIWSASGGLKALGSRIYIYRVMPKCLNVSVPLWSYTGGVCRQPMFGEEGNNKSWLEYTRLKQAGGHGETRRFDILKAIYNRELATGPPIPFQAVRASDGGSVEYRRVAATSFPKVLPPSFLSFLFSYYGVRGVDQNARFGDGADSRTSE